MLLVIFILSASNAFQFPSPYFAKPPFSSGPYYNETDTWQGYLYVEEWGVLDVDENCSISMHHFDSIEIKDNVRLIAEPESKFILKDWNRAIIYANIILKRNSSLILNHHASLVSKSGFTLGQNAYMGLNRFVSAELEGGLKLGDRSRLIVSDFSNVRIGQLGNLSVITDSEIRIENFSSLIISPNAGLKIEAGSALILNDHVILEVASGTWVKVTKSLVISPWTHHVINGNMKLPMDGLEYT